MHSVDIHPFLQALRKAKLAPVTGKDGETIDAVKACCPFHEDSTPSFAVMANGGYLCQGCGAKGHVNELCDHLGIPRVSAQGEARLRPTLEATYEYRDQRGRLCGVVERHRDDNGKKTLPKTLVNGELVWGRKRPFPLYRIDEVARASKLDVVWFAEGEKCVDELVRHGLLATTNQGGSKAFRNADLDSLEVLNGRTVVVLPDNDEPGEQLAEQVLRELRSRGCSVSILRLPGLAEGEDCVEWFERGGTAEELKRLAESEVGRSRAEAAFAREARKYAELVEAGQASLSDARGALLSALSSRPEDKPRGTTVADAFEELARRIESGDQDRGWRWGADPLDRFMGPLRRKKLVALAGDNGSGKTALALQVADEVARQGSAVRVYSQEMDAIENVERLAARRFQRPVAQLSAAEARRLRDEYASIPFTIEDRRVDIDFLIADIRLWASTQPDPGLVVLDFVQLVERRNGQQEHEAVGEVAYALKSLAKDLDISVICLGQLELQARRGHTRLSKASVRGGGQLSDAADVFLLLEVGEPTGDGNMVKCIVDKHRQGKRGDFEMEFAGSCYEFRDKYPSKLLDERDESYYDSIVDGAVEYF